MESGAPTPKIYILPNSLVMVHSSFVAWFPIHWGGLSTFSTSSPKLASSNISPLGPLTGLFGPLYGSCKVVLPSYTQIVEEILKAASPEGATLDSTLFQVSFLLVCNL